MKTKRVPFDIEKAKAGAKIVTRGGYPVRLGLFDLKGKHSYPITGAVDKDGKENVHFFTAEGKWSILYNESPLGLFIEEEDEETDYNPYKDDVTPKFKVGDKVVLKWDKSLVGSITSVSLEGTYSIKFEDFRVCWYSEQELEPLHKIEKKTRKMTYKELSWWLREHPEEHREYTHEDIRKSSSNVYSCYDYNTSYADEEVNEYIRIRKNGGEWQEPFIEI